jgi:hypothetical protein
MSLSVPDWRETAPSRFPDNNDLGGFAFEFLRRNPDYVQACAKPRERKGPAERKEVDPAARRWGLRFSD